VRDNQWFRSFSLIAVLASCGGDGGGAQKADSKTGTLCERICTRSQAAKCKNDAPNCEAECENQISLTPSVCKTKERAFTACAERSKFTCDAEGEAEAVSCAKQFDDLYDCLEASVAPDPSDDDDDDDDSTADAGIRQSDASAAQTDAAAGDRCSPQADDNACDLCLRQNCCAEVATCDGDCVGIFDCAIACDSQECVADCVTSATPSGRQNFLTLTSCTEQHCASACGDE
jgi:hypothetical protein